MAEILVASSCLLQTRITFALYNWQVKFNLKNFTHGTVFVHCMPFTFFMIFFSPLFCLETPFAALTGTADAHVLSVSQHSA